MQDAWDTRWPLGSRSRRAAREIFIDDLEAGPWQPLARYSVPSGPIKIEVVEVVLGVPRFQAVPEDVGLRVADVEHLTPRGPIDAQRGQMLELYLSPRLVTAIAHDLRTEGDDVRILTLRFDFWAQAHSEREELVVEINPKLKRLGKVDLRLDRNQMELRLPGAAGAAKADRIELCTLLAALPPTARLLKGRIAHSSVSVGVAAGDPSVRALIGDCLTLMPDADDQGVADIPSEPHGDAGWVFPQRSLVDVAFPARQRLGLDASLLNRRLHSLSALGLQNQLRVAVSVEHTLAFTGDDGSTAAQTETQTLEIDLTYDLSPSLFLELPGAGTVIPLFEKRGARDGTAVIPIPVMLPPSLDGRLVDVPREEIGLSFTLRLIGGNQPLSVQPFLHIDRVDKEYRPLDLVSFAPTGDTHSFEPAVIKVPLRPLIERFVTAGEKSARLLLFLRRVSAQHTKADDDQITIDLTLEQPRDGALLCIDWGTSSIAAGFTDDRNPQAVLALPLGEVFRRAQGRNAVRAAVQAGAVLLDEDMDDLIPSQLALARRLNFRAEFRPFTFSDLRASGTSDMAVRRRIVALQRHYDIALPFRINSLEREDEAFVMPPLKLLLAENHDKLVLREPVLARGTDDRVAATTEISVPLLVLDCLDELRGFYLTESLRLLADRDPGRSAQLDRALTGDQLRLVLTHPCGLGRRLVKRYRDAGRLMLARLDRGLFPELPLAGDLRHTGAPDDSGVILVPESLAAAFYAMRTEIGSGGLRITERPARVIALDFGAGTFDVSVLDVEFARGDVKSSDMRSWDVRCHYGIRVGGHDIDRALTRLVDALLADLVVDRPGLDYVHPIGDETPQGRVADTEKDRLLARRRYQQALEFAKRELTAELFRAAEAGGDWTWTDQYLRIKIGRIGDQDWPVAAASKRLPQNPIASLAGGKVRLVVTREPLADRKSYYENIVLEISNIFSPEAIREFSEAPRVQAAIQDVVALGDLITRRLPEASLGWLEARGQGLRPGSATYLAVTGRAALWPPVFAGFQRLAQSLDASILGGRYGAARPSPMAPEEMKQAVMLGAYHLARFPQFLGQPVPPSPLAIRFIPLPGQAGAGPGTARIVYVDDLLKGADTGVLAGLDHGSLLQLARVVPGIEHLADIVDQQTTQLWTDLLPGAINPLTLTVSRKMPDRLDIEVERGGDDRDIRVVTFKSDWPLRCPIHDDGSTFLTQRTSGPGARGAPTPRRTGR